MNRGNVYVFRTSGLDSPAHSNIKIENKEDRQRRSFEMRILVVDKTNEKTICDMDPGPCTTDPSHATLNKLEIASIIICSFFVIMSLGAAIYYYYYRKKTKTAHDIVKMESEL